MNSETKSCCVNFRTHLAFSLTAKLINLIRGQKLRNPKNVPNRLCARELPSHFLNLTSHKHILPLFSGANETLFVSNSCGEILFYSGSGIIYKQSKTDLLHPNMNTKKRESLSQFLLRSYIIRALRRESLVKMFSIL